MENEGIQNDELTTAHDMFCHHYIVNCNATEAYIEVFKPGSYGGARVSASQLLAKPNIRARIKELMDERNGRTLIDGDAVVTGLIDVWHRCTIATPVMVFDPVEKAMVQARDEAGQGLWEFDSTGANRALELLGKHTGIFGKDNAQTKNEGGKTDPELLALIAAKLNGNATPTG